MTDTTTTAKRRRRGQISKDEGALNEIVELLRGFKRYEFDSRAAILVLDEIADALVKAGRL